MKITQEPEEFRPVTITIESKEELIDVLNAFTMVGQGLKKKLAYAAEELDKAYRRDHEDYSGE